MRRWLIMSTALLALLSGCKSMSLIKPTAVANLVATSGSKVSGSVNFLQRGEVVVVEADINGLTPGNHGFHIHDKGDCRAADASSAGPHFNPEGTPHGGPTSSSRHAGDLGNIVAGADGHAMIRIDLTGVTLGTEANSIIGRAVIIHADLASQPAGNAGARIACGLIGKNPDKIF
jgi:superoxide dismutase, Cu-Zn family